MLLRLANIAVTAVVAHILAPSDFGVFTVALTAYAVIFNLSELGIASCLVRADLSINVMAPTMFSVSLVMSAIAGASMSAFARPIATALGSAAGAGPIKVMALSVLISGFTAVPGAQLTRDFRQDKLLLANVISLIPSTVALIFLAKSGSGAMAFAWSRVIASFAMGCVMIASAPKHYMPGLSRGALFTLFKFGLPLAGANFVNYILINVDYVFVGHLMGPVPLGTYMLAFTLASAPTLLLGNVINSVAMPAFSRVKRDPDRLSEALVAALRAISLILMPMCSLLMVLARPLVLTLYGTKWKAAAEVLSILTFYGGISIICVLFANVLTGLGKAKFCLFVQLFWISALVPAMALGVYQKGIVGAAVAHIVVIGPFILPVYLFVLRRATGVRLTRLGKAVVPSLLAASAAALAASGAASQFARPLLQLLAGLVVGGLIYAAVVAPQALALLGEERARKLRKLPVFRGYETAARAMGLAVAVTSGPNRYRRRAGYVARHATATERRGTVAATLPPPSVSEGSGADGLHNTVAEAARDAV